ncbi:MAG: universal stress protein [Muribaculaceae bacterium]|nr:universal stress protein [Muribaculaceae bacterium]
MEQTDFITLVVHTDERATKLKEVLESHGINVMLEDVHLDQLPLPAGVKKVRIPVSDLTVGLQVIESGENAAAPLAMARLSGIGSELLIPVDFTDASLLAVRAGFNLAKIFGVKVTLINTYISPIFTPSEPYPEVQSDSEQIDMIAESDMIALAASRFKAFKKRIKAEQEKGNIPDIGDYKLVQKEGVPEKIIHDYCRDKHPMLIVMATRGVHKKANDLVGSVTAEVIDACRTPVFTVPDNFEGSLSGIKRVLLFCTQTPIDMVTMRGIMRALKYPQVDIHLVAASDNVSGPASSDLSKLCNYFAQLYPTAKFKVESTSKGKFDDRISQIITDNNIQMLIVPNKKSSAFTRFFKPTLAHRILFENDLPLLVIPV